MYPGLMSTAAALLASARALALPLDVRNACVFLSPLFSSLTALSTYALVRVTMERQGTALLCAALVGV